MRQLSHSNLLSFRTDALYGRNSYNFCWFVVCSIKKDWAKKQNSGPRNGFLGRYFKKKKNFTSRKLPVITQDGLKDHNDCIFWSAREDTLEQPFQCITQVVWQDHLKPIVNEDNFWLCDHELTTVTTRQCIPPIIPSYKIIIMFCLICSRQWWPLFSN